MRGRVIAVAALVGSCAAPLPREGVATYAQAARALGNLMSEVEQVCTRTGWIRGPYTCDLLRKYGGVATASLGAPPHRKVALSKRDRANVRDALATFRGALAAARREATIDQDAIAVLDPLAREIRVAMGPADPWHPAPFRWDETTRSYWITVVIDGDRRLETEITRGDQTDPQLRVTTSETDSTTIYDYELTVSDTSPHGLEAVRIPCVEMARTFALRGGTERYIRPWGEEDYCNFIVSQRLGAPPARLSFESVILPGLGWALATAASPPYAWPEEASNAQRLEAKLTADSLSGRVPEGPNRRFLAIVPKVSRPWLRDPTEGLEYLEEEIAIICRETDWIRPAAACRDLGERVQAMQQMARTVLVEQEDWRLAAHWVPLQAAVADLARVVEGGRGTTFSREADLILSPRLREMGRRLPPR